MSIHAGNCIVNHRMFQRKCQSHDRFICAHLTGKHRGRLMMGDAIICFSSSLLYRSMIRAHLLPLVLGKGKKTFSPKFCCWSIRPRKQETKPKELSQVCLFSFSFEVQNFKNCFEILFLLRLVLLWLYVCIVTAWCLLAVVRRPSISGNKPQPCVPVRLANTTGEGAVSISVLFTCASTEYLTSH